MLGVEEPQNKSGQHVITCPCCQQKSKLESVKDSPYIASLHEVKQIMSRKLSLLTCALCKEEPTTLQGSYCTECDIDRFWCENCVTQADHIHDLVPLEDIQGEHSPLKPCTNCEMEDHKEKEVKYFCTECETAICNYCSQTEHGKHDKVLVKTIASNLKSQMEILIDKQLKEAQKKMEEVRRIDEEYEEVCNQETKVENEMNTFFQAIHGCLEEKKEQILAKMKEESGKERALLKRQKKFIQNHEEVIRFAMEATAALLIHATSVEVIDLKKSLDAIVKEVKEEEQAHCDPERKRLQMNFVKAQESLDILKAKGIGFLQIQSDTIANQSRAGGSGTKEATQW